MNLKVVGLGLAMALAMAAAPGCAADAQTDDGDANGNAEEANTSADELSRYAAKLQGAFDGEGTSRPPTFEGIVFNADGTFFADLDTGIRCITTPCPSHERLAGTFTATKSYLRLEAKAGQTSSFYGRYKYTLSGSSLSLTRTGSGWTGWSESFSKTTSYCADASDCASQGLIHPMCAPGHWTCGTSSANRCGFACGTPLPTSTVWPSTATQLVAESPGGGFVPPAPAGSACNIGKAKYTLDVTTKLLSWETCETNQNQQPYQLVTGSRTITAKEYAAVDAAMNAVTVTHEDICGADKPLLTIKVTTPAGQKEYTDSFYSCWGGKRTFVDHIDGVFGALRAAAH